MRNEGLPDAIEASPDDEKVATVTLGELVRSLRISVRLRMISQRVRLMKRSLAPRVLQIPRKMKTPDKANCK